MASTEANVQKVAILVQGYPTLTLGLKVPTGSSVLNSRLLESQGYHVISVPYTEFSTKDKLVRRVQYLEQRVRNIEIHSNKGSAPAQSQSSSRQ